MKLSIDEVYTFKLNSGEELISKVKAVDGAEIILGEPCSVAPGPQGMGLVPSIFTSDPKGEVRLNTNSVTLYAVTDASVKLKYIEATTGIKLPDKKLILG
jgi:hypothetical protein